jgi:hypothetical protein
MHTEAGAAGTQGTEPWSCRASGAAMTCVISHTRGRGAGSYFYREIPHLEGGMRHDPYFGWNVDGGLLNSRDVDCSVVGVSSGVRPCRSPTRVNRHHGRAVRSRASGTIPVLPGRRSQQAPCPPWQDSRWATAKPPWPTVRLAFAQIITAPSASGEEAREAPESVRSVRWSRMPDCLQSVGHRR